MHAHKRGARLLETFGEVNGVLLLVRPAASELGGDGHVNGIGDATYDIGRQLGGLHESRALAASHDLAHGASHVHVDEREPIAQTLGDARGLTRHAIGLRTEQLHGEHGLFLGRVGQGEGLDAVVLEALGAHHLGERQARSIAYAKGAKGAIGHAGHGRKPQGRRKVCLDLRHEELTRRQRRG